MAERSKSVELKVGIFVFLGLVILTWFVLWIGDFKLMKIGYHINVKYGFANGIKIGAPVRIAGVEKGEVKEIKLSHDDEGKPRIIVKAWLDGDAKVPADSRAWVNTLGLLGEKYLEIIPGTRYDKLLKEEDILVGEDPTSVQEVTDLAKEISLQAKDTLSDMQETLKVLSSVLTDMHEGKGTIGKFFTDDRLYMNVEEMTADLKKNPWKLLYRPK
jgi:phospholipid/cholesterol/gamma-HCH transport system substrate-binding protein